MSNDPLSLYTAQDKALIIVPKITSILSITGSIYIAQHVFFNPKLRTITYHRIMLALACSDLVLSFFYFLGSWMVPRGTENVFLASGTTATCTVAGFFTQAFALTTALYSASLCVYYWLVLLNNRTYNQPNASPNVIRKSVEQLLHWVPLVVGIGCAIVPIPLDMYNSALHVCWIMSLPDNCGDLDEDGVYIPCQRGANAWIYQWLLLYLGVWAAFLFITLCFYLIYRKVRIMEQDTSQSLTVSNQGANNSNKPRSLSQQQEEQQQQQQRQRAQQLYESSRAVAIQGLLYILSFYGTWFFATLARVHFAITGQDNFVLHLLKVLFFPLQGFWNAVIYTRPHYRVWRKRYEHYYRDQSRGPAGDVEVSNYSRSRNVHCCCCYCIFICPHSSMHYKGFYFWTIVQWVREWLETIFPKKKRRQTDFDQVGVPTTNDDDDDDEHNGDDLQQYRNGVPKESFVDDQVGAEEEQKEPDSDEEQQLLLVLQDTTKGASSTATSSSPWNSSLSSSRPKGHEVVAEQPKDSASSTSGNTCTGTTTASGNSGNTGQKHNASTTTTNKAVMPASPPTASTSASSKVAKKKQMMKFNHNEHDSWLWLSLGFLSETDAESTAARSGYVPKDLERSNG